MQQSTSEALEIAKKFLWPNETESEGSQVYICLAVRAACRTGQITEVNRDLLIHEVYTLIPGATSLAGYLHQNKKLPEAVKASDWGYNLKHSMYLTLRNNFVERVRARLISKENKL
jgi:hypothetical protein